MYPKTPAQASELVHRLLDIIPYRVVVAQAMITRLGLGRRFWKCPWSRQAVSRGDEVSVGITCKYDSWMPRVDAPRANQQAA